MLNDIPVVIFCGGKGTRLRSVTENKIPKPLVPVNGVPLVQRIIVDLHAQGFRKFILCVGHLSHCIKDYFSNFDKYNSDMKIENGKIYINTPKWFEDISLDIIETGKTSGTAYRLKYIFDRIDSEFYCVTYGDGLSDVSMMRHKELLEIDKKLKCVITGVNPPGRFGSLKISGSYLVGEFNEKKRVSNNLINGGFMLIRRSFNGYLDQIDASHMLEQMPFERCSAQGEMA